MCLLFMSGEFLDAPTPLTQCFGGRPGPRSWVTAAATGVLGRCSSGLFFGGRPWGRLIWAPSGSGCRRGRPGPRLPTAGSSGGAFFRGRPRFLAGAGTSASSTATEFLRGRPRPRFTTGCVVPASDASSVFDGRPRFFGGDGRYASSLGVTLWRGRSGSCPQTVESSSSSSSTSSSKYSGSPWCRCPGRRIGGSASVCAMKR